MKRPLVALGALSIIAVIITCFFKYDYRASIPQGATSSPVIVVELGKHAGLRVLQKRILLAINKIVAEELKKIKCQPSQKIIDAAFQLKSRLWTTVFYVGEIATDQETLIIEILVLMQRLGVGTAAINGVKISAQAEFFGKNRDEIVVMLEDDGQLQRLHSEIAQTLTSISKLYKQYHKKDFFVIQGWSQTPFIPGVSLGRVRTYDIELLIKNQQPAVDSGRVIEKIKKRIQLELFPQLALDEWHRAVDCKNFELYGYRRSSLRSFPLGGMQR